jgi:UDP-N-acetylmuramate dehydrogenase
MAVGGPALVQEILCDEELPLALEKAAANESPIFVLGEGSNVIFPDSGWPGTVIRLRTQGMEFDGEEVTVAAGVSFDRVVAACVDRSLAGIECLSGIPGSAGAAPVQNVGAYGQDLAGVLHKLRAYDLSTQSWVELSPARCQFSYRDSLFKRQKAPRWIITSITLRLHLHGMGKLDYPDLARLDMDPHNLQGIRRAVLAIRAAKGMLLDPLDPHSRSCGSFFTNPVLDPAAYEALARLLPADHPAHAVPGGWKIPAAYLIEQAGIAKGFSIGQACISRKHALAIVNRGKASSREILQLASEVQARVEARFGVKLQAEPVLLAPP